MNHPYFNEIKFGINDGSIEVESRGTRFSKTLGLSGVMKKGEYNEKE